MKKSRQGHWGDPYNYEAEENRVSPGLGSASVWETEAWVDMDAAEEVPGELLDQAYDALNRLYKKASKRREERMPRRGESWQ